MKKAIKVSLIILLVLVLAIAALVMVAVKQSSEKLAAMVNVDIDMEQLADGIYTGSSDGGLVKVQVQVEVKDHHIISIELLRHDNGKGAPAEAMLDEMIEQNTDNVDGVSGASMSSSTIRNAVNAALQKGLVPGTEAGS